MNRERLFGRALWLACALVPAVAGAAELSPQEAAGKHFYLHGVTAAGGAVQARVGPSDTLVPAASVPCAGCHGPDGLGRPEGAIRPPDITWRELAKAYGHRHATGRSHPAFDAKSFADSVVRGVDPAGNKLDSSMPRYQLGEGDLADLMAYLRRLEKDYDPGLGEVVLRIGTIAPRAGRLGEVGQVTTGVVQAYADAINARGGLFGRKLEVVALEFPEDRAAALANAQRLLEAENVFAVVSPMVPGLEAEFSAVAEKAGVPVVAPVVLLADGVASKGRTTFNLLSGTREQARALAKYAATELHMGNAVAALVAPDGAGYAELAAVLDEQLRSHGWNSLHAARYATGQPPPRQLVNELQQRGVQVIFFFGSDGDLAEFGRNVRDAIWSPYLLAPGSKVARSALQLPATFGNRVFLAYPTLPGDIKGQGAAALAELQKDRQLGTRHQPAQAASFAGMRVLEEGLRRAGRDASRAKLLGALEGLHEFDTGVVPAIGYGPDRRIGVLGAHIVTVDLNARSFRPTGRYIKLY